MNSFSAIKIKHYRKEFFCENYCNFNFSSLFLLDISVEKSTKRNHRIMREIR